MNEKDATFTFRLSSDLKKAFEHAAQVTDKPAAQVLREFMREYAKKHAQGSLAL